MTDFADLAMRVDTSDLKEGERAQDSFGRSAERMERRTSIAARGAGKAIGLLGVAIAGAFASGAVVRGISEFETSMSRVAAVSRATGRDLADMRDIAQDLGARTEFSASQAADGLGFLAMAGFNASESIAAIPAVLDLATASGMGLASAADIASNVMSGFGIAADNAANVTDVLAAASSRANTDVMQLGQAMSTVAPIAAALGIGVEDTAAAIGVMSDAGIQGERAGTALRGVLASLAGPTTQAQAALAKYGLTSEDVNPEMRSMADIMGDLGARGLTTADAMTIFGREAASGALVMVEGARRLGEFGDELRNVEGAAGDMAKVMRDNLGGDIKGLQSAISGIILAMGEAGLTAAIRGVVQGLTAMSRGVVTVIDFVGDARGYFIAAALGLTAYYAPAIVAATFQTGLFIGSLITLRGALIATGIGAFIVGAGLLVNKFLELAESVGGFGSAFKIVALNVKAASADMQVFFLTAIGKMAYAFTEFTWSVADGLNSLFGSNLMGASGELTQSINRSIIALEDRAAAARAEVASLRDTIGTVSASDPDSLVAALSNAGAAANAALSGSGGAIQAIEEATDAVQDMGQAVRNDLSQAWSRFVDRGFKDFDQFGRDVLKTFMRMIGQMILFGRNNPVQIGVGMAGGIGGMMSGLGNATGGLAGMANTALAGVGGLAGLGSAFTGGMNFFTSGVASGGIGGGLSAIGTALSGATGGLGGMAAAAGALALPLAGIGLLFGALRTKTRELDNGLRVTIDGMDATAETFRKIEKSRFFGLMTSRSTTYQDDPDNPVLEAVGDIQSAVVSAARTLGFGADIFEDFSYRFRVSLKGLTEDQKIKAINDELAKMGDGFASLIPGMESMAQAIAAADAAVAEAGALGRTRFESEMLMASRRRGEFTIAGAGDGGTRTEDLIRLRSMDEAGKKTAEEAAAQRGIMERLLRIWERFEIDGVPQGPVVT